MKDINIYITYIILQSLNFFPHCHYYPIKLYYKFYPIYSENEIIVFGKSFRKTWKINMLLYNIKNNHYYIYRIT